MKKRLLEVVLAGILAVQSVIPTFAAVTSTRNTGNSVLVKTDNYKKYPVNYPCWLWWDGYCYYYQTPGLYLKNTTTPDGYTVDELGRWTENGVPVHNGLGSARVGTDEYIGKSDDERWSIMKEKLRVIFEESLVGPDWDNISPASGELIHIDNYTYQMGEDFIYQDISSALYGNNITIRYSKEGVWAEIGSSWSDDAYNIVDPLSRSYYLEQVDLKEKTIKALLGDNVGQELFNQVNAHALKLSDYDGHIPYYDENGNVIHGYTLFNMKTNQNDFIEDPNDDGWKTVLGRGGDGINASTMDLTSWKNRTTDYGKQFSVEDFNGSLRITIKN